MDLNRHLPPPILLATTISSEEKEDIRETPIFETATLSSSLTATATLTPALMTTGSLTATIIPTVDVPAIDFDTQLYDGFDTSPLAIWQIGPGWTLASSDGGQALLGSGTVGPVALNLPPIADSGLAALVRLERRALVLFARRSEAGDYTLTVDPLGALTLARSGVVIASATLTYPLANGWHSVRWVVSGDRIGVWVDDVPTLSATDAAPLPPGTFGFEIAQTPDGAVWIDDVSAVWQGREAPAPTIPPLDAAVITNVTTQFTEQDYRDVLVSNSAATSSASRWFQRNNVENVSMPTTAAFPSWRMDEMEFIYLNEDNTPCRKKMLDFSVVETNLCEAATSIVPTIPNALYDPVVSPDGLRMAYLRVSSNGSRVDVVIRTLTQLGDTGSTNETILLTTIPGINASVNLALMPAWSDDGLLAFTAGTLVADPSLTLESLRIYVVNPATNSLISISAGGGLVAPFWSDSDKLAAIDPNPFLPNPYVQITPSTGVMLPSFSPTTTELWGRMWVPGGDATTPYAGMTFSAGVTLTPSIFGPNIPVGTTGFLPKVRCAECILAMHGVGLAAAGQPVAWTVQDRQDIADGVMITAYALGIQFEYPLPTRQSRHAFRRFFRLIDPASITFIRSTTSGAACQTITRVVTCNAGNIHSEYTAVHELGHVFTSQTGGQASGPTFFGMIDKPPSTPNATTGTNQPWLQDYGNMAVLGEVADRLDPTTGSRGDDWTRGDRGWGNAARSDAFANGGLEPCSFQQNAFDVRDFSLALTPANANPTTLQAVKNAERDEAAADMFLNWAYSRAFSGLGFANTDWGTVYDCTTPGPADTRNPGDARYNFMASLVMPTLATRFPTVTPTPTP